MTKPTDTAIVAYKGFDKNLQCRGYQFEVGKTYEHDGDVIACQSGFHVCTNPFDVWRYYPPKDGNRFATVGYSGGVSTHSEDSKLAVRSLSVNCEISLFAFIKAGIAVLFERAERADAIKSGYYSTSATSGYYSTSATSGYYSTSATSGDYSTSATSGDYSTSVAKGKDSVAVANGKNSRVMAGCDGNVLLAVEVDDYGKIISYAAGRAGEEGIRAGVYYVCKGGKLVEAA